MTEEHDSGGQRDTGLPREEVGTSKKVSQELQPAYDALASELNVRRSSLESFREKYAPSISPVGHCGMCRGTGICPVCMGRGVEYDYMCAGCSPEIEIEPGQFQKAGCCTCSTPLDGAHLQTLLFLSTHGGE